MNFLYKIFIPFIAEQVLFVWIFRKYNALKLSFMLPGFFAHLTKIISSSILAKKRQREISKQIFILVCIYETQGFLTMNFAGKLTPIVYNICYQSRFISLCGLSIILLKKKFHIVQYCGLVLIVTGILLSTFLKQSNNKKQENSPIAVVAILISGFCSSLGAVFFEKYIRYKIVDFNSYFFIFSSISLCVNLIVTSCECIEKKISLTNTLSHAFFYYFVIIVVINTYFISIICTKICPITRNLLFIGISNLSNIIVQKILDEKITIDMIVALIVCNVGILCYEYKNIRKLLGYKDDKIETNNK